MKLRGRICAHRVVDLISEVLEARPVRVSVLHRSAATSNDHRSCAALTLVEIVVVVALVVLLALLIIPALQVSSRDDRRSVCLSNTRQIGLAMKGYAMDHNDCFPAVSNPLLPPTSTSVFHSLTNIYLQPDKAYVCFKDPAKSPFLDGHLTSTNNSYACVVSNTTGIQGITWFVDPDTPLVLDRGLIGAPGYIGTLISNRWSTASPHGTDGGNVFHVGGHASFKRVLDQYIQSETTNWMDGFILEP